MESYIKNTLGLHVDIRTWNDSTTLPDELRKEREFFLMELCGIRCLVIKEMTSDFQLSTFLKEKPLLQQYCQCQLVLCFERITSYQRKCLIESGQSFIVPENQLYMPFVGIALSEHFKSVVTTGTQLTAVAQFILLFFLYHDNQEYYSKLEISQKLEINLMNVTRGVQELEELSLLTTRKKGRSSMVTLTQGRGETFENAKTYLRNPVQRRMFVMKEDWMMELPKSGQEALDSKNGTRKALYATRAIEKKRYLEIADRMKIVDPAWDTKTEYLELEVWRYDPSRFEGKEFVDSISHALSLMGDDATAVEVNIDKLKI